MASAEFILLVGLLGMAVGSFLNVCIDRLPRNLSIVTLPSHCERCQHPLAPLDLVPVLSYLWLRGRCRYCKASIPLRIPAVETTTGLLFAYVAFRYETTIETAVVWPTFGPTWKMSEFWNTAMRPAASAPSPASRSVTTSPV